MSGLVPKSFMEEISDSSAVHVHTSIANETEIYLQESPLLAEAPCLEIDDESTSDDTAKRISVVQEFIATEKKYVSDLNTMIELFMKPMLSMKNIELRELFSNLPEILFVNESILMDLNLMSENNDGIGNIFLKHVFFL